MSIITGGQIIPGSGLGTPLLNAGAPVNGAAGTYAGVAAVGALLNDTTNAQLYQNQGTQAAPNWVKVGTEA